MIKIFRGGDPAHLEQYNKIAYALKCEEGITLYSPHPTERYIYWENKDYFAYGGVQLIYDPLLHQYILKNIIFFIDFEFYSSDLEDEELHQIYDQLGQKFYQAMYLQLGKIAAQEENDPNHLLLELPEHIVSDCLVHGGWPIQEDQGVVENHYEKLLRGLSSEYQNDCLNLFKHSDFRVLLSLRAGRQEKKHPIHPNVQPCTNVEETNQGFVLPN